MPPHHLIPLDYTSPHHHNPAAMQKTVHSEILRSALTAKGWDQKQLAEALGVSGQAVTNWMKGVDFPRPATLLKLATTLSLSFEQLVRSDTTDQPVIAFRKKGAASNAASVMSLTRTVDGV